MKSKLDRPTTDLISATRLMMIYGLVVHHVFTIPGTSSFPRTGMRDYGFLAPEAISSLVHMAFMTAVPTLSLISGYLFFLGPNQNYLTTMTKKFWTIAAPSWSWCAAWLVFAYLLYTAGQQFGLFEWANYEFDALTFKTLVNGIFGYDKMPFAFQFWFIHDLILTILFYPLIKLLCKLLGLVFPLAVLLAWFSGVELPLFFSPNVTVFFILGAYLSLSKKFDLSLVYHNKKMIAFAIVCLFFILLASRAWTFIIFDQSSQVADLIRSKTFLLLLRLLGVLAFAQIILFLSKHAKRAFEILVKYSGYSFFIFATHYPIIEFVKIFFSQMFASPNSTTVFLTWLFVPILTVSICIFAAKVLSKISPTLFHLINGRRALSLN